MKWFYFFLLLATITSQAQEANDTINLGNKMAITVDATAKPQRIRLSPFNKADPFVEDSTGAVTLFYLSSAKINSINQDSVTQAALRASLRLLLTQSAVARSSELNNQIMQLLSQTPIPIKSVQTLVPDLKKVMEGQILPFYPVKERAPVMIKISQIELSPYTEVNVITTSRRAFPIDIKGDFDSVACASECRGRGIDCQIQITDLRGAK